jgi:hypothetical protein
MLVAFPSLNSKSTIAVLIGMCCLLTACSRENPLITPPEYVAPAIPFCTDDSPFSFQLVERVDFTNIYSDFVVTPDPEEEGDNQQGDNQDGDNQEENAQISVLSANNRQIKFSVQAPFLSNTTTITPVPLNDYKLDERGQIVRDGENNPILVLLNKELTPDMLANLTDERIAELEASLPEVSIISYSIEYMENGEQKSIVLENVLNVQARLLQGINEFTLKIRASVLVPVTGLECTALKDDPTSRLVNLNYEHVYQINRAGLNNFLSEKLDTSAFVVKENDSLGNVIALNDRFLVLGVPNESSNLQGVHPVETLIQPEGAPQSGAAFVFVKNEEDNWQAHSLIKSSNNEAGDRFGAAITLNGELLVISAPGEDSNGEGIYSSDAVSASPVKINNSASSSGAVYTFRFDEETNNWQELHYIKPDQNLISDGNFNKRFGELLALTDRLLLISAPGEDSVSGSEEDSTLPDSGAVYAYAISGSFDEISFISPIKAFNPGAGDLFGSSLSVSDRFIVIGAPREDNSRRSVLNDLANSTDLASIENDNRQDAGAVYVYSFNSANSLIELFSYLKATNSDVNDFFGSSLVIENSTLVVGAPGEDGSGVGFNRDMQTNGSTDSGAVYIFSLNENSNAWVETAYIKADDNQPQSLFGQYVGLHENNLVVAAPSFDGELIQNEGKVYLYEHNAELLELNGSFRSSLKSENMQTGKTLAIMNKHLIIGASAFTELDSGTGEEIPLSGLVMSSQ